MDLQIIQNKIFEVRGCRVMLDYHLAELYQVETRALKQAVKRNIERFPSDFMFVLTKEEANLLLSIGVSQNVIPPDYNFGVAMPMAFTEQGVAMLSSVLRSKIAIVENPLKVVPLIHSNLTPVKFSHSPFCLFLFSSYSSCPLCRVLH